MRNFRVKEWQHYSSKISALTQFQPTRLSMPASNHLHARGLYLSLPHACLITSSLTFIPSQFCKDLTFFFYSRKFVWNQVHSTSLPDPQAKPKAVQGGQSLETYKSLWVQPETADKISGDDMEVGLMHNGAGSRVWAEHPKVQNGKNPHKNWANSSKFLFNDSKNEPSPRQLGQIRAACLEETCFWYQDFQWDHLKKSMLSSLR